MCSRVILILLGVFLFPGVSHAGPICRGFWDCLPLILFGLIHDPIYVALPGFVLLSGWWLCRAFGQGLAASRFLRIAWVCFGLLLIYSLIVVFTREEDGATKFARKKLEAFHELPYVVYRVEELPPGYESSAYAVGEFSMVQAGVRNGDPSIRKQRGNIAVFLGRDHATWFDLFQMEAIASGDGLCPGYDFQAQYQNERKFSGPCEKVAETEGGWIIHRSEPITGIFNSRVEHLSVRVDNTFLVFRFYRAIDESQITSLIPIIDSMRPFTLESLVAQGEESSRFPWSPVNRNVKLPAAPRSVTLAPRVPPARRPSTP